MNVWVEAPGDNGSAVWGCDHCEHGAWARTHRDARTEATRHAHTHSATVTIVGIKRKSRDAQLVDLTEQGWTDREIAKALQLRDVFAVTRIRARLTRGA